jgi:hypothetical protein
LGASLRSGGSPAFVAEGVVLDAGADDAGALARRIAWVAGLAPAAVPAFAALFTREGVLERRVVVDRFAGDVTERIRRFYPFLEVVELPETDELSVVAGVVAQAHMYIACHVSTLVFAVFLGRAAVLVERQPDGMECMAVGQMFATMAGVEYVPMRRAEVCECAFDDLECYLRTEPRFERHVSDEEIRGAVEMMLECERSGLRSGE